MFKGISRLLGGDPVAKEIQRYGETVAQINALEAQMQALSDSDLAAKTDEFRGRLADGETLADLLPEAFATVREVSVRTIGLRHFDVQLVGGVALHEGKIVEMKTGEGKTLVATMPIYLNALLGNGVHLVTVNDYLARRDARWMGPIYRFLGLSVGVLQEAARTEHGRKAFLYDPEREAGQEDVHQLLMVDRKEAYAADITYGTNNEFGFDYLRDNMAQSLEARSQRGHFYAILDEVDNILIDEARTPLIISGPSHEDPELYLEMSRVVKQLAAEDFEINERDRNVSLTEIGEDHVERLLGQPLRDPDRPEDITPEQARLMGYLEQSLRAEFLFKRNKDYVVQGGRVVIVDEFTGRMMTGRRWSDGLHQAVEAKEGVRIREENVTYATITLQNYFRMYEKLAGMTGTAVTEAEEFNKIYSVDVLPLPTNLEFIAMQPETELLEVEYRENGDKFGYFARVDDQDQQPVFWRRKDYADVVYRTEEAKLRAVVLEILRRQVIGQPMLVGTTSVELSEKLAARLRSDLLQRLVMIQILREAYMEAHEIPDDGMRVEELQQLYGPLESLSPALMRPFSRELGLSLNPAKPENLDRLTKMLELDPEDQGRLTQALGGGIPHNVLNAKKHAEESQIIASAGAFGAVTIATNMAGRGVDIKLGGEIDEDRLAAVNRVLRRLGQEDPESLNLEERLQALEGADPETIGIYEAEIQEFRRFMEEQHLVREVGGLHVVGSERHEARRIDNQLRGRAARQGDPGSSRFFLSLEDELMRLFGGQQVSGLMQRLNIDDATPIAHGIVNRTIEQSQTRVEGANFDRRKHLLEYDDVLNQQREIFYSQRNRVFAKGDLSEDMAQMLRAEVESHVQLALADLEGPWRLLAWLEEIQPTLGLETERPYPSFMLSLMLEELREEESAELLKARLLQIASESLEAQLEHSILASEEQLERSIERLDEQVRQRVDLADLAIEGAIMEAEETGSAVDVRSLITAVESNAGLKIQVEGEALDQIRSDPSRLRDSVPQLIELSLGTRVWAGILSAAERRIGEGLDLELRLATPIDWDAAADQLRGAAQAAGDSRKQRTLADLERELESRLSGGSIDDRLKLRTLVGMAYTQQSIFDRRTHQKRELIVPRLTYAHYAAGLLDQVQEQEQDLINQVLDHLRGAERALREMLGSSEVRRLGANQLGDLDGRLEGELRAALGEATYQQHAQSGPISSLPDEIQDTVGGAIGSALLTEYHRKLLLSVGDRLWVEYLTQMEALRTSIGLEAYGQRDPLVQYKSRAVDMFRGLLGSIRSGIVSRMYRVQAAAPPRPQTPPRRPRPERAQADDGQPAKTKKRRRRRRKKR